MNGLSGMIVPRPRLRSQHVLRLKVLEAVTRTVMEANEAMARSISLKVPPGLMHSIRLCGSLFMLLTWPSPAPAAEQVDLKLVLATDVSRSIDDTELRLEREGTAEAFLDPEVIKAIQNGSLGRIAVATFDFSSPQDNKVTMEWHIIHDRASAVALAGTIRGTPRTRGRRTSVSGALELGSLLIESSENDIRATRKVIDVSGDGPNNDGNPMTEVHDKVIAQGIVVNGLPVMDDNANGYFPDLDKYYAACVAGGRGSFVLAVHNYKDFSAAMRHKLILEISQNERPIKEAKSGPVKSSALLKVVAAPQASPAPQVLRAGPNEFSKQCDIQGGGFGFRRFGTF
jgi:Protein of unknown function (DUF1194)